MTSSTKTVPDSDAGALTIKHFEPTGIAPRGFRAAPTQQILPANSPSVGDAVGAAYASTYLRAYAGIDSGDDVIRSLSSVLEAVEREYDEDCAEALRRAIAARLAGFRVAGRAGARCAETDSKRSVRALQKWRLKRVIEYVDANLANKISLVDLASVAQLSRMHFASQFRVATGLRPHEFLLRRRIRRSEQLLKSGTMTIVEIALAVGFQTQAHFTTVFKRFAGCTPRYWRMANQPPSVQLARAGTHTETAAAL